MIRYTTPTLILRLPIDITEAKVIATIRQNNRSYSKQISKDDMQSDDANGTVIYLRLSQADTGALDANTTCSVQVNWIYEDGSRDASLEKSIRISDNLLNKEIDYGE